MFPCPAIEFRFCGRWPRIKRSKTVSSAYSTCSRDSITDARDWKRDKRSKSFRLMPSTAEPRPSASDSRLSSDSLPTSSPVGNFRWFICTLLLIGVTKNYMDRQVLGVLKTTLQHDLGWDEISYSNLVFAFQAAYAVGMLVMGPVLDRLGTRWGYSLSMIFWSAASMAHAACNSIFSFTMARSAIGLGESGVFPASIKTVAEWFPQKERALATGIFNAGTNVGAILTPFIVPWITKEYGWRAAFIVTGALGFVWLILWLLFYRKPEEHPRLSKSELE